MNQSPRFAEEPSIVYLPIIKKRPLENKSNKENIVPESIANIKADQHVKDAKALISLMTKSPVS